MQNRFWLGVVLVAALQLSVVVQAATDLTLVERANGSDVVEATVQKIRKSQIFPDDYNFLERLAYIESEFGTAKNAPNDGGIWQVNSAFLSQSKIPRLSSYHSGISSSFGIQWANVTYRDLLKPLYSGLAASLYLTSLPEAIPQKIDDQARFWIEYYNQRDYTEETFVVKIREMEKQQRNCSGKVDVEIILDGSESVGSADFETARNFVKSLVNTFSLNDTRVGFMVYSTLVTKVFPLDNGLTTAQMITAITNFRYEGGGTNTNEALRQGVFDIQAAPEKPGVPKTMIVLTDGQSRSPGGVSNIEMARQANISSFAIGIGTGIKEAELLQLAQNVSTNVFALTDFDALAEFFKRLNSEACALPQRPPFNSTTADEIEGGERRFYEFPLPSNGVTVQIGSLIGSVTGWFSRTTENPSSAINDGLLGSSTQITNPNGASKVYLTVEGADRNNLYTITVYEGKV